MDYKDPLTSFEHNMVKFGIHGPGRFVGFDTLIPNGALGFSVTHDGSNQTLPNQLGDNIGPIGVFMSKQGVTVVEDAPITGLNIDSNAGNNNDRIDLLIATHQYTEIAGGQNAVYGIVKGSVFQTLRPSVGKYDVILGQILMPANVIDVSFATYTKERNPDSGDGPDARIDLPNVYQGTNLNNHAGIISFPDGTDAALCTTWGFPSTGNSFNLSPSKNYNLDALRIAGITNQDGGTITLILNPFVKIRSGIQPDGTSITKGYRPIVIGANFFTGTDSFNGQPVGFIQPVNAPNTIWFVELFMFNQTWYVKSVSGINYDNTWKKGMVVEVHMSAQDVINNTETDGLGKNLWAGWQICNGNRSTLDKRCRVSVMASNIPNAGAPALSSTLLTYSVGDIGGEAQHTMLISELVAHSHQLVDSVHGGFFYNDTNSGGGLFSLKGDNDNSNANGPIGTTIVGSGQPFNVRQPFIATVYFEKL